MTDFNFGPAAVGELIVFGSQRPGFGEQVDEWIAFMRGNAIRRVCCLLDEEQIAGYADLLGQYRAAFGRANVCWAPVQDMQLADVAMLTGTILPFLAQSDESGQRVVVHCAAGRGRAGHVLAAWLVHRRGYSAEDAVKAVMAVPGTNRYPAEAVASEPTPARLYVLLRACRPE
jgi:protein-tyrosine phosphatase